MRLRIGWIAGTCCAHAFACAFATAPARAQGTIQKCLDAEGRIIYQDTGCAMGETIGVLHRDISIADPAALERAREDQDRADRFANARTRIAIAAEDRTYRQVAAQPMAAAEPLYVYLDNSQPGVVVLREPLGRARVDRRSTMTANSGARSSGTMPIPGIMQSPAPCISAQCRKK